MTLKFHVARAPIAAALCAGMAACAGPGAGVGSASNQVLPAKIIAPLQPGWLSPAAKRATARLIYVSDNSANAIEIYPQGKSNPSPIGKITDGISAPLGNFVDGKGTLYVANNGNNTVTEYPQGSTSPSVTLSTDISGPISVAADAKGTVAVGEFASGEILEFPAGSTTPTVTITFLSRPEALTFDRTRHLYAAWNEDTGSGLTGEVSKCQRMRAVCVSQGIAQGQSGGLALDPSGNIILGDQTNSVINIYAPGATQPMRTISTTGHDPYKFELNRGGKTLYVADNTHALVAIYDYATGTLTGTISQGLLSAWGVSLYPAAAYAP